MMLNPPSKLSLPLEHACEILKDTVLRSSKDMIEFVYRDIKITIYPNGSIMFYHFTDFDAACTYADEIIGLITETRVNE